MILAMEHTLTIIEEHVDQMIEAIFSERGQEGAAYLLCGRSVTDGETRLLVRDVIPVEDQHYLAREADHLSIASPSYAAASKRALERGDSVVFVHSHPTGVETFSAQDDREEPKLMEFLASRVPGVPHGSLVVVSRTMMRGRLWGGPTWRDLDRIRVVGTRVRLIDQRMAADPIPEFFDRQVRAFGPDIQRLLRRLHIGGTELEKSAIFERLARATGGTAGDGRGESTVSARDLFAWS